MPGDFEGSSQMELSKTNKHLLEKLGVTFKSDFPENLNSFDYIDLKKAPQCYLDLIFKAIWPDCHYFMLRKDQLNLQSKEIDFEDYDLLCDIMEFMQIECWSYDKAEIVSTTDSYIDMEEQFRGKKYIIIGNVHGNYTLFLDVSHFEKDGDPIIEIVYPYERGGIKVYYSSKLSEFLSRLVKE